MKVRVLKLMAVVLMAATTSVVVAPSMASADPGGNPTYCSGWADEFGFRWRACTAFRTTRVDHSIEIQKLSPGEGYLWYSGSDYRINGYWGDCTDTYWEHFYSGEYSAHYCSTARVSGYTYQTRATIGDDSGLWVHSPAVTG